VKNFLRATVFILFVLATFVGTAAAAPMKNNYPTLISAEYIPSVGPVFIFSADEKLTGKELRGFLEVSGGSDYDLYCTQREDLTIRCTTSKKVQDVNVVLYLGEYVYWTYVPPAIQYCYSVWDYAPDGNWYDYGPHCQNKPAEYDDWIWFYNPDWDDVYNYYFWWQEDSGCSTGIVGNAYYYDGCPEPGV
jgi:hypothetical protein